MALTRTDAAAAAYLPLEPRSVATFSSRRLAVRPGRRLQTLALRFRILGGTTRLNPQRRDSERPSVFTFDGQQRHHPVEFDQPTGGNNEATSRPNW